MNFATRKWAAFVVVVVMLGIVSYSYVRAALSVTYSRAAPADLPPGQRRAAIEPDVPGSNLAWPSEDLADPRYQPDGARVDKRASPATKGTQTADRLVETATAGFHRLEIFIDGLTPNQPHTVSIFAGPAERSGIALEIRDNKPGKYGVVRFDLLKREATLTRGDVTDFGVEVLVGGWQRIWATMPFSNDRAVIDLELLNAAGDSTYSGDGKSGLSIRGLQVEPAATLHVYVPTTTGPVKAAGAGPMGWTAK